MEFSRFSLGLRFAMTKDAGLSEEKVWEILFTTVAPELVTDMNLYGIWDDTAEYEPEPAYICLFSNSSLPNAKALFFALSHDYTLTSYLTAYRPFIQNNQVEKCGKVDFLGKIEADGSVSHGDIRFGSMRFTGQTGRKQQPKHPLAKHIVIAPESTGGWTSFDLCRRMARAAAAAFPDACILSQRIANGGPGTLDTLVSANNGRYEGCGFDSQDGTGIKKIRYGVLPDETAILETADCGEIPLPEVLGAIQKRGYTKVVLAAGQDPCRMEEIPGMAITVLSNYPDADNRNSESLRYCSGIHTVLSACGFLLLLRGASWVITGTTLLDEKVARLGASVDSVVYHSRKNGIPTAVLACRDSQQFFGKIDEQEAVKLPANTIEEACDALLSLCKTNGQSR